MKEETLKMMRNMRINPASSDYNFSHKLNKYLYEYGFCFELFNGCEGCIGENNYLVLWKQEEIEDLNKDYCVDKFLTGILLIGSDGADTAYGINSNGEYVEVPFIGMDDDEVSVIAHDFDEFIKFLSN